MSRTIRCRHITPRGWIVNDGGPVLPRSNPTKIADREAWKKESNGLGLIAGGGLLRQHWRDRPFFAKHPWLATTAPDLKRFSARSMRQHERTKCREILFCAENGIDVQFKQREEIIDRWSFD